MFRCFEVQLVDIDMFFLDISMFLQALKIPVVAMFAGCGGLELAWCKPWP